MSEQNDRTGDDAYEHHGGFPVYEPVKAGPNFGRLVEAFRRLQDLAVSTHAPDDVVDEAIAKQKRSGTCSSRTRSGRVSRRPASTWTSPGAEVCCCRRS